MEALKASGVCRRYGMQEVLKDFSLTIQEGGFEALMGPSGSGKSTFLHLAAGLLSADAGEILVGGRDVVKMGDAEATKFRRRHVGVVFQSFNLLNERTVRDNIVLPLRLDGAKADEARLASLVSALGIEGVLNKRPEELSGGEQQRVAIARALLAEPDVVLADEPTGNLDAKASKAICALLGDLHKSEKSAILVVTHDPQVAAAAQKVHFLKDGRIAASHDTQGDPELVSKLYLETYR
ncbi:MAG: ABC transporter ATP-binding protein [Kiritimatiellae bacterium]|jgi:putative ABC transport system ATP-binding protein|nr:ABC transporter ATP-binding protein [Kiritimatiellia bacterium]